MLRALALTVLLTACASVPPERRESPDRSARQGARAREGHGNPPAGDGAAPPECTSDADCVIVSALRSCELPCGACPTAVPRSRAHVDQGSGQSQSQSQSMEDMDRLCPWIVHVT